jgi:hypothetical protein
MEEVKDHLGRGSIRVTSDRYGHLFPSARLVLAESLETTFLRSVSAEGRKRDKNCKIGRTRAEICL